MASQQHETGWAVSVEAVVAGLTDWQTAHPQASFAEIEAAVEERVTELRGKLLEEALVQRAATASRDGGEAAAAWTCEACGQQLQRRGEATRPLLVRGNRSVRLTRPYDACPSCGAGLFPPRRGA
ncbi:MAG: hypothetical protein ACR2PL_05670 [Dehalococcoidia bacterium]